MLFAIRFAASLAISIWGVAMVVLGMAHGVLVWGLLGIAVCAVGAPLLASNPWAAGRIYPPGNGVQCT